LFDKLGSDKLKWYEYKLSSELINLSLTIADGEVLRLYLGPMFAPDQLGRDKMYPSWFR
jgi:hypothetical protein